MLWSQLSIQDSGSSWCGIVLWDDSKNNYQNSKNYSQKTTQKLSKKGKNYGNWVF